MAGINWSLIEAILLLAFFDKTISLTFPFRVVKNCRAMILLLFIALLKLELFDHIFCLSWAAVSFLRCHIFMNVAIFTQKDTELIKGLLK